MIRMLVVFYWLTYELSGLEIQSQITELFWGDFYSPFFKCRFV